MYRVAIPMTSIYLLCHASQIATYLSNLLAGAIVPPRMPQAMYTSPTVYGQIIHGLHVHPDNASTLDDYQYQQ
jgi:hypothetical protein